MELDLVIKEAYYSPILGFQSAQKLYRKLKGEYPTITLKKIQDFIKKQSVAQVHKETGIDKSQYNQVLAFGFGECLIDILDQSNYSSKNSGYRYLLLIQDI